MVNKSTLEQLNLINAKIYVFNSLNIICLNSSYALDKTFAYKKLMLYCYT